jgi:putative adenylate-forming enzyme
MIKILNVLLAYWKARTLSFSSRAALEAYQARQLRAHLNWLTRNSSYFAGCRDAKTNTALPLSQFPRMDKESMMANFDAMCTAPVPLQAILALAKEAEASRDFQGTVSGYTVGLSSGTSAIRGAFIVSAKEKARWAGTIMAKLLPAGLFAGERVALFLRADSGLYQTVKSPWLSFRFFDLVSNFHARTLELVDYRPTILVAPAQVLRQLALEVLTEGLKLTPKKVVSVAEVLEEQDRELIESAFGNVHQVYQATEGFLASTCEHGTLHLNEAFLHIEKEWLDHEQRRFVPLITDFTRTTQPIVRYRLNDVLVAKKYPCACGQVTQAIETVEGRCDDMLVLAAKRGGTVPLFADVLSRLLAQKLPITADYRLTQLDATTLRLDVQVPETELHAVQIWLTGKLAELGVDTALLQWELSRTVPPFNPSVKRRRIICLGKSA